jgi:hypothetical protein
MVLEILKFLADIRLKLRPETTELICHRYTDPGMHSRREILKNLATLPLLGALGWGAFRVKDKYGVDVLSGATIQVNAGSLSELKGTCPRGGLVNTI